MTSTTEGTDEVEEPTATTLEDEGVMMAEVDGEVETPTEVVGEEDGEVVIPTELDVVAGVVDGVVEGLVLTISVVLVVEAGVDKAEVETGVVLTVWTTDDFVLVEW